MTGRDRQANGTFGFARGGKGGATPSATSLRLVHAKDEQAVKSSPAPRRSTIEKTAPKAEPQAAPRRPMRSSMAVSDDDGWVIRPKLAEPKGRASRERWIGPGQTPNPTLVASGPLETTPDAAPESGYRRWFALGLAGMVYVVGIVGLWTMVHGFGSNPPSSLTPAGDSQPLPPIDDEIDVRDARLNGPFIPKLKPDVPFGPGGDIAASDLKTRS